ncbi:hypothetical protein Ddye_018347 [Dipteronia dyeriana]|uniref:Uncharacterized protein n=1 Tax=Dipteronia dyeriana TaxID=168575 RepID=A0AAD9UB05_9ROSI|nr:hypothetical protein Ddye_018347 [Dipteronia dyeriana]
MSIDPMEHELSEIIEDDTDHDIIRQVSSSTEWITTINRQMDGEINLFLSIRLAYIFGKDRATGKTTYTSENLATDVDVDDNFDNEFEMFGNFSPMSVNQTDYNQAIHLTLSQLFSNKMSRS